MVDLDLLRLRIAVEKASAASPRERHRAAQRHRASTPSTITPTPALAACARADACALIKSGRDKLHSSAVDALERRAMTERQTVEAELFVARSPTSQHVDLSREPPGQERHRETASSHE